MVQLFQLSNLKITSVTINDDGTFSGTWEPAEPPLVEPDATERWISPEDISVAAEELNLEAGVATRAFHALGRSTTNNKAARQFFERTLISQGYSVELASLVSAMNQPNFDGYYLSIKNVGGACLAVLREVVNHLASQPAG